MNLFESEKLAAMRDFMLTALHNRSMRWEQIDAVMGGGADLMEVVQYICTWGRDDGRLAALLINSTLGIKLSPQEILGLFKILPAAGPSSIAAPRKHQSSSGRARRSGGNLGIGRRVRELRASLGFSADEAARRLRCNADELRRLESSIEQELDLPLMLVARTSRVFGIHMHLLLGGPESSPTTRTLFEAALGDERNQLVLRDLENEAARSLVCIDPTVTVREYVHVRRQIEHRLVRRLKEREATASATNRRYRLDETNIISEFNLLAMLRIARVAANGGEA